LYNHKNIRFLKLQQYNEAIIKQKKLNQQKPASTGEGKHLKDYDLNEVTAFLHDKG